MSTAKFQIITNVFKKPHIIIWKMFRISASSIVQLSWHVHKDNEVQVLVGHIKSRKTLEYNWPCRQWKFCKVIKLHDHGQAEKSPLYIANDIERKNIEVRPILN